MRAVLLYLCHAAASAQAAYLGLRNQGNTCYMNSLLQTLYAVPEFRQAVYRPDSGRGNGSSAIDLVPLELQRVFYELQHAEAIGPKSVQKGSRVVLAGDVARSTSSRTCRNFPACCVMPCSPQCRHTA